MLTTTILLFSYANLDGAVIASIALSLAVMLEAIISKYFAINILAKIKGNLNDNPEEELTYKGIVQFYYPLAITSILSLGVHPFVTFLIGQSRMSIESLAVLPVINSLVFVFRAVGLSFHEAFIALLGKNGEGYKPLRNFGFVVGSLATIFLFGITTTPFATIWFHNISGLSIELTELSIIPAIIVSILPALTFLISVQRAVLVYTRNTLPLTTATIIEVVIIVVVLFVGITYFNLVGVMAAAIAYISGRLIANIYLTFPYNRAVSKF